MYSILKGRGTISEAYVQQEQFEAARRLLDQRLADSLAWFGRGSWDYIVVCDPVSAGGDRAG